VGVLYCNILQRNADPDRYDSYLNTLSKDDLRLPNIIREFIISEYFRKKFILNQTLNEIIQNLLCGIFGVGTLTGIGAKMTAIDLIPASRTAEFDASHRALPISRLQPPQILPLFRPVSLNPPKELVDTGMRDANSYVGPLTSLNVPQQCLHEVI
jgi:hypothetical protein